ncbi:transcriptional regulator [Paraburkholderia nemoris]|uniref:transcriptional regulator n=1 Tax=Paraburkholderia nemoris TaxID=2793076 RepID=UPI0038B73491
MPAAKLADWFGLNKTGLTPLALNRMPDAYAIEAAGNATAGSTYTYDGLLAHDLLNLAGAGLSVAAGSALAKRYSARLEIMLQAEVDAIKKASAQQQQGRRSGRPSLKPANDNERARYPALDAHYREADPAFIGDLLVTRDRNGQWQYDKQKLLRIAHDDSHPRVRHARDGLTLIYIGRHRGTHWRNDGSYHAVISALGSAASTLMIAGTHGAALPVVAAGYAVASAREMLFLRKPLVEERQKLRDAKAELMTRMVKHRLNGFDKNGAEHFEAANRRPSASGQPLDAPAYGLPLEAKAGIVAVAFADAEKKVANRNVGRWIPGALIDHRKSTAAKDEERSIVVNHALDIMRNELTRLERRSASVLTELHAIALDPDLSLSSRVLKLKVYINAHPGLQAIHALLTDIGMRTGEALEVMARLVELQLTASGRADNSNPLLADAVRLANLTGQPQFKRATPATLGTAINEALSRRLVLG